ncbi:MAG TPA: hypothetical protein VFN57_17840 [Thermomicrobiaceae bacterium]|nr:hypothetical protein [Thermomicrobiaceae bacterium]
MAAVVWLGGGAYYVLALRPQLRSADEQARALARQAQREFGEWASVATIVLIATGVALMFDRLTNGRGTVAYVLLLTIKVVAALVAFWIAGSFGRRYRARRPARFPMIDRSWLILSLGTVAFVIGIALASIYPSGIGQR